MAADTPPKILAIFRKVQVEEKALPREMLYLADELVLGEAEALGIPEGGIALAYNERDLVRVERRENPQVMLGARSERGGEGPAAQGDR